MGLFGNKVPKNCSLEKAKEWMEKGWNQYDYGKEEKAVEIFLQLAEQGFGEAQNAMGICCKTGRGVPKDLNQAFDWFSKAADNNYGAAYYNLGKLFEKMQHVTMADEKLFQYYIKGASLGNVKAVYETGCCYASGKGVEKNLLNAVSHFITAALKGNKPADEKLKAAALDQAYLPYVKDYLLPYYKNLPDSDVCAGYILGYCHEFGVGISADPVAAAAYYAKAAAGRVGTNLTEAEVIANIKVRTKMLK